MSTPKSLEELLDTVGQHCACTAVPDVIRRLRKLAETVDALSQDGYVTISLSDVREILEGRMSDDRPAIALSSYHGATRLTFDVHDALARRDARITALVSRVAKLERQCLALAIIFACPWVALVLLLLLDLVIP